MRNLRVRLARLLLRNANLNLDDLSFVTSTDFEEMIFENQKNLLRTGLVEVFKQLPSENLQSLVLLNERLTDDQKIAIACIFANQASAVDNSKYYLW